MFVSVVVVVVGLYVMVLWIGEIKKSQETHFIIKVEESWYFTAALKGRVLALG